MSYVCLFRLYRPTRFEDVFGQEHVTRTLQNALRTGRTAQAYLFTGPRGVGKTSVARILAKALNCDAGPTPEPCGECESCRRIAAGNSLSVIEIDAASHRSIDDIRSLREDVQFSPTDGRIKVYILDEAHQITGPAFEAFLKTLEEPPAHAMFVLATTEPQKIPATILSRCQRFDFRRVAVEAIVARLRQVTGAESLNVDEPALYAVARAADGGLRDALSVLDQIVAFSGATVTAQDVAEVLGSLSAEVRFALGEVLLDRDVPRALDWLAELLDAGRDARQIVAEALAHCRLLLLARLRCAPDELKALPDDLRRRLEAQAEGFEPDRLMQVVDAWAACDKQLRWHPQPRILLEVTLLDLLLETRPRPAVSDPGTPSLPGREQGEVQTRQSGTGPHSGRGNERESEDALEAAPAPRRPARAVPKPEETPEQPLADGEPLTLEAVRERMPRFLSLIREGWPPLMAHLVHAEPLAVEGDEVVFGFHGWEASLNICQQAERRKILEETWRRVLGRPVVFKGMLAEAPRPAAEAPAADVSDLGEAVSLAMQTFPGSREIDG
ncbi:MAG: DNA polymerase III subunit gamma/tau [Armatimonadetes bacterium]|nr:DNA polymerase III subunit gamma/tau [Armatimonadota bacterium]